MTTTHLVVFCIGFCWLNLDVFILNHLPPFLPLPISLKSMSRKTLNTGSWFTVMLVFYFDCHMEKNFAIVSIILRAKRNLENVSGLHKLVSGRVYHCVLRTPNMTTLLLVFSSWYFFREVTVILCRSFFFVWLCLIQNEALTVIFLKMINIVIFWLYVF